MENDGLGIADIPCVSHGKEKETASPSEQVAKGIINILPAPTTRPCDLSILHLADLRFGWKGPHEIYEKEHLKAYNALVKTFADGKLPEDLRPNVITIAGDIAYNGYEQEYKDCQTKFIDPLLAAVDLTKENLIVCPGNHDIDIQRDNRSAYIPEKGHPISGNRRWNLTRECFETLSDKFHNYSKHFFGEEGLHTLVRKEKLCNVDFYSFNSAWYSSYHEKSDKNLILGQQICDGYVSEARRIYREKKRPTIALMHHSIAIDSTGFGWYHLEECAPSIGQGGSGISFIQEIENSFYIVLTGSPHYDENVIPYPLDNHYPIIISSGITRYTRDTVTNPAYSAAIVRLDGSTVYVTIIRYDLHSTDDYWRIVSEHRFGGENPVHEGILYDERLKTLDLMIKEKRDWDAILQYVLKLFRDGPSELKNKYINTILQQNNKNTSSEELSSEDENERSRGN